MNKKLSGYYYFIPIITLIVGFTLFITLLVQDVKSLMSFDEKQVISVDGTGKQVVSFDEEGRYYLFIDAFFVRDIMTEQNDDHTAIFLKRNDGNGDIIQELTIKMVNDQAKRIYFHELSDSHKITYTINNIEYNAILYVDIDEPGEYEIITDAVTDEFDAIDDLMLTQFDIAGILYGVMKYIIIIGVTLSISIVSFIIVLVKRRKYIEAEFVKQHPYNN